MMCFRPLVFISLYFTRKFTGPGDSMVFLSMTESNMGQCGRGQIYQFKGGIKYMLLSFSNVNKHLFFVAYTSIPDFTCHFEDGTKDPKYLKFPITKTNQNIILVIKIRKGARISTLWFTIVFYGFLKFHLYYFEFIINYNYFFLDIKNLCFILKNLDFLIFYATYFFRQKVYICFLQNAIPFKM